MIVPMQQVLLLCLASDREATLDALRELGVLHLTPVKPPESRDLEQARARLAHIQRTLEALPLQRDAAPTGQPAEAVAEKIWSLLSSQRDVQEELEELRQERRRIEPFGSFDPTVVNELRARGVHIRLYQVPPGRTPSVPEGVVVQTLREDQSGTYLAAISRAPVELDAFEVRLPELSLNELDRRISDAEGRLTATQHALEAHAGDRPALLALAASAEEAVHFVEAREGMGAAAPVTYLRGYCPKESVPALEAKAAKMGWGVLVSDPEAGATVPTLIRNPGWVRPIKAVFDFIGVLPGYEEIDISAVFLFFLSIFFAMLVGDAGYGLIFLALTMWGRRKMPKAPAYPFHLLYIMSTFTIVWGAVTGSWFGAGNLPAVLDGLSVAWLKQPKNVMFLCFLIGAVHLTIAHLWIILRTWNSPKALAQLGWIGSTWTMFFMARNLVLGESLPGWIGPLFIVSVILIILFMTAPRDFKTEWFNHVMLPLNLVSNFVDVVSYIRLFAVGTAGFAVASSFNKMILGGGVEGVLAGLVAGLLLFLGHALNIMLCAMGVLVHGVRLNTLEFSSHIGMAWTGLPYRPFRRARTEANEQEA